MNERDERLKRRIERAMKNLQSFTSSEHDALYRKAMLSIADNVTGEPMQVPKKSFSEILCAKFTPWRPGRRVMYPALEDSDFTGTDVHDISDMARAAFIANRAIAGMMR